MLWKDLLSGLDNVRGKIRSEVNLNEEAHAEHKVVGDLTHLIDQVGAEKPRTVLVELPCDDEGRPIYPTVVTPVHIQQPTTSTTPNDGQVRAVPLERTPRIKRAPDVVAVSEKEFGKE